jgi:hypothetical protein
MPTDNGTQDNAQQDTPGTAGETPATWESILSGLPDDARAAYEQHTQGLQSALKDERRQRQELAKQLRDATGQLEAGSKARQDLEALQAQLEDAQRRADFATEAGGHGVANVRLAYLAAQEFDLFDRRGNVQWSALKEAAPELFAQPQPARGNAGSGTQAPPTPAEDMNAYIRRMAGR